MRKILFMLCICLGLLLAQSALSQDAQKTAGGGNTGISGRWIISADFYGTQLYLSMELTQEGDKLTGTFDGDKLEGTVNGNSIHFLAKDDQGGTEECTAAIQGDTIRLGQLLKLAGIIDSGSDAKGLLAHEPVFVNAEPETRRGRQLHAGDTVRVGGEELRLIAAGPPRQA